MYIMNDGIRNASIDSSNDYKRIGISRMHRGGGQERRKLINANAENFYKQDVERVMC